MSAVIAAALFAQLVVVGGDPAACRARHAAIVRPVGVLSLRALLELMSRNDCVRYLVPAHLLDKLLPFGGSLQTVKDWRGPVRVALDGLGIKLADETVVRVDGPPAPPPVATEDELDRGITCKTPGHCVIDAKLFARVLGDTNALATSARIVPSMHDGKLEGFRLFGIHPDSVWIRIGFENGDTVQTINGMEMSSPERALEIYSKLRTATDLVVRIVRRGQPLTLTYVIR